MQNALITGNIPLTRSPGGCIPVGMPVSFHTGISPPINSVPLWEVSYDDGVSWQTTTLTYINGQWDLPTTMQSNMGRWQYRLSYIDYGSCTKKVSNTIPLDIDFYFTSQNDVVLDAINTEGIHTITLSEYAGIKLQWQIG